MKRFRLFTKVCALLVLLFGVTAVAVATLSAWSLDSNMSESYQSKGTAIARSVAGSSVEVFLFRDAATIQAMIDQYLDTRGVAYVFVVNARGEVICHTFSPSVPPAVRALKGDKEKVTTQTVHLEGQGDRIDIAAPILDGELGFVHVGMDSADIRAAVWSAVLRQVGFIALVFLGSMVLAAVVVRRLIRPLREMAQALRDIAQGEADLTRRLEVRSEDEIGEVARWFNAFVEKQHDTVAQIRAFSQQVAGASQQLAGTTEHLSAGTQEQASSLEETAASLEEITSSVKQNADNAQQANLLAGGSREIAEKGGQVVQSAVAAMAEINQASRKITDIISAIDEIAFQTNLLALNAAVEAARAGEFGRGFAVVAAEVRGLAQRSASAAKEIKGLIQDSARKVEAGSELVGKSGQALGEIVASVRRVTDLMAEIAASSREQSSGIGQVNRAVAQMDGVVQENAAQTEELTSTAQALAHQAQQLQALVGSFRLAEGPPAAVAVVPGPAQPARPAARAVARPADGPAPARPSRLAGLNGSHAHARDGFEEF
jgi:methyl-accepting chemotaxis protein